MQEAEDLEARALAGGPGAAKADRDDEIKPFVHKCAHMWWRPHAAWFVEQGGAGRSGKNSRGIPDLVSTCTCNPAGARATARSHRKGRRTRMRTRGTALCTGTCGAAAQVRLGRGGGREDGRHGSHGTPTQGKHASIDGWAASGSSVHGWLASSDQLPPHHTSNCSPFRLSCALCLLQPAWTCCPTILATSCCPSCCPLCSSGCTTQTGAPGSRVRAVCGCTASHGQAMIRTAVALFLISSSLVPRAQHVSPSSRMSFSVTPSACTAMLALGAPSQHTSLTLL